MAELRQICGKIDNEIADAREAATVRQWANYSRPAFISNLEGVIPRMETIRTLFQSAQNELEKASAAEKPDLRAHLNDMAQLITVLKRNRDMERERLGKLKSEGVHAIAETVTVPELYSDLEQKALSMLLKCTYATERLRVFGRKGEPGIQAKGAQRNILDLLEKKENELESLRQRYEENRRNTFLGLAEKESSIENENELNEITRKLEVKTGLLKKQFEGAKEALTLAGKKVSELEERLAGVEELESQAMGKTFELMTMLKKERDYAKKMLIEIEHETIQLRNTYSRELLGLQEEKITLKNSIEERFMREISEMRRELSEKSKTISHLQEMVSNREKRLERIDEDNHRLRLSNAAFQKHDAVKRHFKRSGAGKEA